MDRGLRGCGSCSASRARQSADVCGHLVGTASPLTRVKRSGAGSASRASDDAGATVAASLVCSQFPGVQVAQGGERVDAEACERQHEDEVNGSE